MKKDKADIDEILARYFAGEMDSEVLDKLNAWVKESEDNRQQFEMLKSIWQEQSTEPRSINTTTQESLDRIWKQGTTQPKKKNRFFLITFFNQLPQIAAVAMLVIIFIPVAWYWMASGNGAKKVLESVAYIIKENPASQRSRFTLPDGSMVWLNCKSSLKYPANFSPTLREVELSGEAFFEVKEDSRRPFVVSSGDISTTALGTTFNVEAYPDKDIIEVALITGKVRIENIIEDNELAVLDPGLGISYNKQSNKLQKKKVNAENVLAWKSGILVFDGDNYDDFVWKIKQWYDVDVTTLGNVPGNWRIRGRFDNAYLTSILDVVSFNKDFSYQLNDKQLTIQFNQKTKK